MTRKRVSPGTRVLEVATALIDATSSLNRGATVAEIRAAHEKRFAAMDSRAFPRALASLEARGEAEKIGGWHRRTQWRHASHPVSYVDPEDTAPTIIEAVEALYRKHGRALTVDEVAAEVWRRGHSSLTAEQVRHRLETLAHASERKAERTLPGWGEPRVQRLEDTTSGGRRRVYWAPIGESVRLPDLADGRDAIRYAVGRAAEAVGRPVTKREVRLWAEIQLADLEARIVDRMAAQIVASSRFRSGLAGAVGSDEGEEAEEGRLRSVRTPLSSRGAYAPRFSARTITPLQAAACLVEDLAVLLRPQTEAQSIEDLRDEAREIGSRVLVEIADAREHALIEE